MNKSLLLEWLLKDVEKFASKQYHFARKYTLEEKIYQLNNRCEIDLPQSFPKTPEKMLPVLRKHFKDDVTFISLVLNNCFPQKYIFYRVSKLEPEIFEGLDYFSEIAPELKLSFSYVGRKGVKRYLALNEALGKIRKS